MPYMILGIPTFIFIIYIFINKKNQIDGWCFLSTTIFVVLLFLYYLFDTGQINKWKVEMGGQKYSVSTEAIEDIIVENIDKLGKVITNVYETFLEEESFDLTKENERVKYVMDDKGQLVVKIKLKYKPIRKTIRIVYNSPFNQTMADFQEIDKNNFVDIVFGEKKEEAINLIKEYNLKGIITYLRDMGESDK
jgi:hypothetical protein